ncbi:MAG: S41 family peptidase [Bryobacterales bacterium]|jgi:carboxyl-terminal processing protease|nr:S41 family peptidase [Bryobacterales bacterium]
MNSHTKIAVVSLSLMMVFLLLVGALLGKNKQDSKGAYPQLSVFTEVLSRIKSEYVEEPELSSVTNGALTGMLEAIDPYASFLNADQFFEYEKFKDSTANVAGVHLSRRYGMIGIVGVVPGSAADVAGLGTGDVVESINNISTRDMPVAYADILLKGARGNEVKMAVIRLGTSASEEVTLSLSKAVSPAVFSRLIEGKYGYVRPEVLSTGRSQQVARAIRGLAGEGAKQFILDLRNTSVGDDAEGVKLADLFVDSGELGWLEGQKVPKMVFSASPATTVTKAPLVVLTNRGTANGAEIAAAALLAVKRAEVVGDRTYGDAGTRKVVNLDDGSALILTLGKYYTSGAKESIQDRGVIPTVPMSDYVRDEPEEDAPSNFDIRDFRRNRPAPEVDKMVRKAIDVLTNGVPKDDQVAVRGQRLLPLAPAA